MGLIKTVVVELAKGSSPGGSRVCGVSGEMIGWGAGTGLGGMLETQGTEAGLPALFAEQSALLSLGAGRPGRVWGEVLVFVAAALDRGRLSVAAVQSGGQWPGDASLSLDNVSSFVVRWMNARGGLGTPNGGMAAWRSQMLGWPGIIHPS